VIATRESNEVARAFEVEKHKHQRADSTRKRRS